MRWQWMLVTIVVGCSSWQTRSSLDATAVSRQYRTYALLAADATEPAIAREVEQQLAAKGLAAVAPGQQPDVVVVYDLARTDYPPMTQPGAFNAWGRTFGEMGTARPIAYGYTERTLVLRFVDARTRQTFWRGSASSPVGGRPSPQEVTAATRDILRRYPSEAVAASARRAG